MNRTRPAKSTKWQFTIASVATIGLIVFSLIIWSSPVHSKIEYSKNNTSLSFSFDSMFGNFNNNNTSQIFNFSSVASCFHSIFDNSNNITSLNFSSVASCFLKPISGTYDNPSLGYRIELPTGWNGVKLTFLPNTVVSSPELALSNQSSIEKFPSHAMMIIMGFDIKSFDILRGFTQYKKDAKCVITFDSQVVINGVTGQQISHECKGELVAGKIREYIFATKNDSLITISFWGNSTSGYDKYLPQFEDSIKTLKISDSSTIQSSPLFQIYQNYQKLAGLYNQTGGG
jgi:hypothetical protein